MKVVAPDTLTQRRDDHGNHCKSKHHQKVQCWQSSRSTEAQRERQGRPQTDRGSRDHRFSAKTEHTASQANAGGKGDWFLKSSDFQRLYNSSSSAILWLSGTPGCGKTTLVNSVQAEIESRTGKTKPTVHFYLQYEGCSEDPAKVILKSLVDKIHAPDTPLKNYSEARRLAALVAGRKCLPPDSLALGHLFRSLLDFLSPEVETFFLIDSFDDYHYVIEHCFPCPA